MKVLSTAVTFILLLIIYSCGEAAKPQDNPQNITALEEIRKEPKVKEAFITDSNVLYVSVDDDGTPRNGYAGYLCEVLSENKASVKLVKVVKVNSIDDPKADNAYGILLGESNCE